MSQDNQKQVCSNEDEYKVINREKGYTKHGTSK